MPPPDRLSQTFIDLCRLPSPSGHEGRVAAYIRRRAAALGLPLEEDDAGPVLGSDTGNLLVRTPGSGEPLLLAAHLDTVPPTLVDGQVPVVVDGDVVHTGGRSILGGDDKAGVAVALELMHHAVSNPAGTRPLEILFTVQEEQGARGARHFDVRRLRARTGFNLDGDTPVGVAIRQAPHKLRFYIDVAGRAAHAALNPEDGVNAVQVIGAIAAALPTGRLDEHSIANLGRIEGGGPINVVPDRARLVGEARSLRRDELDRLKARIASVAMEQAQARRAGAAVEWEELYPGYCVPDDAACVRLFRRACLQAGVEPALVATYGGGDANPLNSKGLQCVVFGLGMEAIHTPQETMRLSRLAQAVQILRFAVAA